MLLLLDSPGTRVGEKGARAAHASHPLPPPASIIISSDTAYLERRRAPPPRRRRGAACSLLEAAAHSHQLVSATAQTGVHRLQMSLAFKSGLNLQEKDGGEGTRGPSRHGHGGGHQLLDLPPLLGPHLLSIIQCSARREEKMSSISSTSCRRAAPDHSSPNLSKSSAWCQALSSGAIASSSHIFNFLTPSFTLRTALTTLSPMKLWPRLTHLLALHLLITRSFASPPSPPFFAFLCNDTLKTSYYLLTSLLLQKAYSVVEDARSNCEVWGPSKQLSRSTPHQMYSPFRNSSRKFVRSHPCPCFHFAISCYTSCNV